MTKSCCIRRTVSAFIAMAAFALVYPGASAHGADALTNSLPATLHAAQEAAHDGGQKGLAVLVLQNDSASQTAEALVAHDASVRYALRGYGLVVLQKKAGPDYRLGFFQDACEGVSTCAEDVFLGKHFETAQLQALNSAASRVPLLLVYKGQNLKPSAVAYGLDDQAQALRLARALPLASAGHPAVQYSNALLED